MTENADHADHIDDDEKHDAQPADTAHMDADEERQRTISSMIMKGVAASMVVGVVPIPFFNFGVMTGTQVALLHSIAREYGFNYSDDAIKNVIATVAAPAVSGITAAGIARAAAVIPVIGVPIAVLSRPAVNGIITYALGHMFNRYHLENRKGYLLSNMQALTEHFNSSLHKLTGLGKGAAKAVKKMPELETTAAS